MIEIIALTASAVLVPAIAAFAWIAKKRIDELQDEVFALSDEVRALEHRVSNWEGCGAGGAGASGTSKIILTNILRKAEGE